MERHSHYRKSADFRQHGAAKTKGKTIEIWLILMAVGYFQWPYAKNKVYFHRLPPKVTLFSAAFFCH
jgi:hypothetical protein